MSQTIKAHGWEYGILICVWIITLTGLWLVPRMRAREAHMSFLFQQVQTWFLGLMVVELGWLEYPVREFDGVNRSSLTFEYLVYPAICVYFNLYFPPKRGLLLKLGYVAAYTSGITLLEILIERNTELILYHEWRWYWTWLSLYGTFWVSRAFFVWFFKINKAPPGENGN